MQTPSKATRSLSEQRPEPWRTAGLPKSCTFGDIPRGEGRAAGSAGRLAGRRASAQDGAVRLILQDVGHEAPLLVLAQGRGAGLQLAGAQLVEADGPVLSPTRAGLQRASGRV